MPTYTPIFVRSPYHEFQSGTANQEVKTELFLYNDPDSVPTNPTHTLSKPIPSSLITTVSFDISPYCREYISHRSFTEVTADTAATVTEYCRVVIKTYLDDVLQTTSYKICFNGFGYFDDGYNPTVGSVVPHMTEGTYYVQESGGHGGIFYNDDQVVTWEADYTGLTTGGTTNVVLANEYGYIPYVHTSYIGEGNKLEISRNSVIVATYFFEEVCETKYTPIDCDFVNRFGAWQRLVFFKANQVEIAANNEKFKMMPASAIYNTSDNIHQTFNHNAQETITCNTGWVPEGHSEVIKELMLSEKILLDGKPVVLSTSNAKLMTHLNDKTINYQLKFMYANDMLNYII